MRDYSDAYLPQTVADQINNGDIKYSRRLYFGNKDFMLITKLKKIEGLKVAWWYCTYRYVKKVKVRKIYTFGFATKGIRGITKEHALEIDNIIRTHFGSDADINSSYDVFWNSLSQNNKEPNYHVVSIKMNPNLIPFMGSIH